MNAQDRQHLTDDRLIALYFGNEEGSAEARTALRQHLHGCEACTWRYAELTAPLQQLRLDAASEADEVFTQARLDLQRESIARRLSEGARAHRVVPFPGAARPARPISARPVVRWVTAAAAAGLLVGVSVGRLLLPGTPPTAGSPRSPQIAALPSGSGVHLQTATYAPRDHASDEAFLTALDIAADRQQIEALSALDEMTPYARPRKR